MIYNTTTTPLKNTEMAVSNGSRNTSSPLFFREQNQKKKVVKTHFEI